MPIILCGVNNKGLFSMILLTTKRAFLAVAFGLLFPVINAVHAAPVSFTYSGTWANSYSGSFGATYSATVVFDNGGSDVENQTFTQADFVSATVVSGSYDYTMLPADITGWSGDFVSDASGILTSGWFNASNGAQSWHFDIDFADPSFTDGAGGSASFFSSYVSSVGQLVSSSPAEPVPALPLYGFIVTAAGLIVMAARRFSGAVKRQV